MVGGEQKDFDWLEPERKKALVKAILARALGGGKCANMAHFGGPPNVPSPIDTRCMEPSCAAAKKFFSLQQMGPIRFSSRIQRLLIGSLVAASQ